MSELPQVRVWSLDLNDPRWSMLDRAVWPHPQEQARADRFIHAADGRNFEASHKAMRWILAHEHKCSPYAISYTHNPWGKPYLKDGLEFSLSHSADKALLAIASHPVGIDLEVNTRRVDSAWFDSIWSIAERQHLGDAVLPNEHLLAIWTRKEAVVKALALGLSQPLSQVMVPLEPKLPAKGRWSLAIMEKGVYPFFCQEILSQEYVACLATPTPCEVVKVDLPRDFSSTVA